MRIVMMTLWLAAYVSFGWGVVRFFRRPDGLSCRARIVAGLGLAFGAWHAYVLVSANACTVWYRLGFALVVWSLMLFWSAVRACGARPLTAIFSMHPPERLVSSGPYRWVRHPFYLAYTLFWFGGALASTSALALLSATAMLALYIGAARREERAFARSAAAAAHAAYRRSTGFFLPRVPAKRPS